MKHVILCAVLATCMLPVNSQFADIVNNMNSSRQVSLDNHENGGLNIGSQEDPDAGKMLAIVFKTQEFCRAELKDFEFDVSFKIESATIYFSGANFRNVETGYITSSSLKPVRSFMARCAPGSVVVFDDVKVMGPDKQLRSIPGARYSLY